MRINKCPRCNSPLVFLIPVVSTDEVVPVFHRVRIDDTNSPVFSAEEIKVISLSTKGKIIAKTGLFCDCCTLASELDLKLKEFVNQPEFMRLESEIFKKIEHKKKNKNLQAEVSL